MTAMKTLLHGLRHTPSIRPALVVEGVQIIQALSLAALVLGIIAMLDVLQLHSVRIQLLVVSVSVGIVAMVQTLREQSAFSRTTAKSIEREHREQHLALWMMLARIVAIPALMVSLIYARREVFYQLQTNSVWVIGGACLGGLLAWMAVKHYRRG